MTHQRRSAQKLLLGAFFIAIVIPGLSIAFSCSQTKP